ncbi:MAG: enoyl-CoA hydratase/isomerase family protein [Alphaproteobacteria bacterium]|nr:MAG: enoyl-CoA hydratase/isomerase family protein [Alphaproteobacteria bacterium]
MSAEVPSYDCLTLSIEGAVATVTLNRPDHRNALSVQLLRELKQVAEYLSGQVRVAAVILRGGDHYFSAGADLKDPETRARPSMPLLERREALKAGPDMCDAWEALEAYTIVAIEGYCIGGGVALALACDLRVIGESGTLRLPEIPLGMNMSWHALPRLVALVGPARAKQFTLFGEALSASEALQWGLVEEVTPDGGAYLRAKQWAAKVAALPPIPLRMSKEAINRASAALHATATFMDRDQFLLSSLTEDSGEAVTAFLEKRPPEFRGK